LQAENLITEAKPEFPKDVGLVWRWAWSVYDPSQKIKTSLIPSIWINVSCFVACNRHFQTWKQFYVSTLRYQ